MGGDSPELGTDALPEAKHPGSSLAYPSSTPTLGRTQEKRSLCFCLLVVLVLQATLAEKHQHAFVNSTPQNLRPNTHVAEIKELQVYFPPTFHVRFA